MTSRRFGTKQLLLLTVVAGLGTLSSAAGQSGLQGTPDCAAGPRLCYDPPVNVGPLINTAKFEGGPSLSQDGLTLLFGAARQNSLGQLDEDIYMATRETTSQPFGPPRNLGAPVNSLGFGDYSPELSRDGLTLYFSSSRPGGLGEADLYVTTRESTDDPWEPPQNLGPNVNSSVLRGPAKHLSKRQDALLGFGPAGRPGRLRYLDGDTGGGLRNLRASSQRGTSGEHSGARVRPSNQPERTATVLLVGQAGQRGPDRHLGGRTQEEQEEGRSVGHSHQRRYTELAILPSDADI